MNKSIEIYYLEMHDPAQLVEKECIDRNFKIMECEVKHFKYNKFLYEFVGEKWQWLDKKDWTNHKWKEYAESDKLRTFVAYLHGTPIGYYELQKQKEDKVQIMYFGLNNRYLGQGLGSCLLSSAIKQAWDWNAKMVHVNTCSLDHPAALPNYIKRGFVHVDTKIKQQQG